MGTNKFLIKLEDANYNGQINVSENGVEKVANKLFNDVLEGNTPALSMIEMFNFIDKVGSKVKGMADLNGKYQFVDLVRDEIKRNSEDGRSCKSKYGTKFELAETGTQYNFKVCGDEEWNQLNKQLEELKDRIKKRETFLKTISESGLSTLDEETGEVKKIYPPIKTSTSSYKQTLLKD